jgi:hypothetical protein
MLTKSFVAISNEVFKKFEHFFSLTPCLSYKNSNFLVSDFLELRYLTFETPGSIKGGFMTCHLMRQCQMSIEVKKSVHNPGND